MCKNNKTLNKAKQSKFDEFYIIKEDAYQTISGYSEQYAGKSVYCNTDDYRISNVWKVFCENFHNWKLKSLTATGFNKHGHGIYAHYDGNTLTTSDLKGNGDFRSMECVNILMESDICVTCPPFSLNREYLHLMYNSGKLFLTLSGLTVCSYPWVIERFKNREITRSSEITNSPRFTVPSSYRSKSIKVLDDGTRIASVRCIWLTNMLTTKFSYKKLSMKKLSESDYEYITTSSGKKVLFPKTINDIPVDYSGLMRLPITCVNFINPKTGFIEGSFKSEYSVVEQNIKVLGNEKDTTGDYRFYDDDGNKKFVGIVVEKTIF